MYKEKSVAVVIPCYNEGTQIMKVLETMPAIVDWMVVVNDLSKDNTAEVVEEARKQNKRVVLINHEVNQGVGGAIATGYKWAAEHAVDVAVVMAGDGQMDPSDLPALLDPVVSGEVDYCKGNRLNTRDAFEKIPKVRYFGNSILSLLTKIASGYWHVADSQTGYTAISLRALRRIEWDKMYKRYGMPNDLLVRLNVENFAVRDVPIQPVYAVGEQSKLKVRKVVFTISWLLVRLFAWRMKEKYIIRDFHPLVFFYLLGAGFMVLSAAFFVRLAFLFVRDHTMPEITFLIFLFCGGMGLITLFFAMWFDMESNKHLR